jgi:hypothetical protein
MWYPRVNAINRVETAENRLKMHFASNIQKLERIPKFYNVYNFFLWLWLDRPIFYGSGTGAGFAGRSNDTSKEITGTYVHLCICSRTREASQV